MFAAQANVQFLMNNWKMAAFKSHQDLQNSNNNNKKSVFWIKWTYKKKSKQLLKYKNLKII